jgi:hypothetical protein
VFFERIDIGPMFRSEVVLATYRKVGVAWVLERDSVWMSLNE